MMTAAMPLSQSGSILKPIIKKLHAEHFEWFHRLFFRNTPVNVSDLNFDIDPLVTAGLMEVCDQVATSSFRITKSNELFIVSDTPAYCGEDRVWYPLPDESLLFSSRIPDCTGERVLDVGCGSGILGIQAAARGAAAVLALDPSPRALAFTRFNAALNECPQVTTLHASLEDFQPTGTFERILCNPPFVPVPDRTPYMLSGYGGRDGLALVHGLFARLGELSHRRTALSLISMSPGDAHWSLLERLFLSEFAGRPMRIRVTDVYGSVQPIEVAYTPFLDCPTFAEWVGWLKQESLTHLHYLLIDAFPAEAFSFERSRLLPPLEDLPESGTWGAMYRVIQNSRAHAQARP